MRAEARRDELAKAEDRAIKGALALQERVGLKLATDGEFRRRSYHSFFYSQLGDITIDVGGAASGQAGTRANQPVSLIDTRVLMTSHCRDQPHIARAPADLRIGMHLCRGNRGGRWHAEGSYDAVAERLFNTIEINFYFLEYNSPRAGKFSPLRWVPPNKNVVLGIVTTKTSEVESKADLNGGSTRRRNI